MLLTNVLPKRQGIFYFFVNIERNNKGSMASQSHCPNTKTL